MGFFVENEFYDDVKGSTPTDSLDENLSAPVITDELLDTYMRFRFDEGMSPQEAVQQMNLEDTPENFAERIERQALRAGRHAL
ncbi:MAG: hypothetical protein M0Z50_16340 [Planctomycetia bacterium]|nr:hypothetical protein [Planctomycetia bacterium]